MLNKNNFMGYVKLLYKLCDDNEDKYLIGCFIDKYYKDIKFRKSTDNKLFGDDNLIKDNKNYKLILNPSKILVDYDFGQ